MNKTRLALVVILALMIASTVSFFFWNFVRDNIVIPIYFLLWVTDLLIKSIPQQAYLAVLVLLCITIGLNTLLRTASDTPPQPRRRPPMADSTRYMHWRRLYRHLYGSFIVRSKLAAESRDFLLGLLAYQEGLDPEQIEAMILDDSFAVPPAVKTLVQQKEFLVPQQASSFLGTFGQRLRHFVFSAEPDAPLPENKHVDEFITFIENRLEIDHAGNQPGH